MHRHLALALSVLALSACDDKPSAPAARPSAAASASAPPSASTSAAPARSAGAPVEAAVFHVVAQGESVTVYPLGAAGIVDAGAFYGVLGEGPLEQDPALFRASVEKSAGGAPRITQALGFGTFLGRWPDQAWAASEAGIVHRVNDLWVTDSPLREGEKLFTIAAWESGRAVAAIRMKEPDIRFQLVGSTAGGVVPAPGKPTPEQDGCAVRFDPDAPYKLAGLPSGHLFAAGRECKTGKPVVERWQPGKVRGEATALEGFGGRAVAIAAVSADEVYAVFAEGSTTGHLAVWDGKAWSHEEGPFGVPSSAFASGDGTAWVVGSLGLYKHPKKGAWTRVEIRGARPTSAWAKDENTLWVVSDEKVLLRFGPSTGTPMLLPREAEVRAIVERDRRWPATAACKKVFVMLAAIGPTGDKAPASFPAVTQAVRGDAALAALPYVAEDIGGTLYAGAKVPSLEVAEKLVAAYKAKHAASTPMVYCHEPAAIKGTLEVR